MADEKDCCSGDALTGEPCTPNEEGIYECAWECSDENKDNDGIPDPCHPHHEEYKRCFLEERDARASLLEGLMDDLDSLGGLLVKGKMTMEKSDEFPNGREVTVFDRTQCSSRDTCLRQVEKNLEALTEEYDQKKAAKAVEVEQAKQKYMLDAKDVCEEFGDDGFCKEFKQTDIPQTFMIVSHQDHMVDYARMHESILKKSSRNAGVKDAKALATLPDALFVDIHTPTCWNGSVWTPCDPMAKSQQFEYKKKVLKGKACKGSYMDRDTEAQLEGFTEESCRFLCDNHEDCKAATFRPYLEKDGKTFSGHCEIMSTSDGVEDAPGAVCMQYVSDAKGNRTMNRNAPSESFDKHYIWNFASPI